MMAPAQKAAAEAIIPILTALLAPAARVAEVSSLTSLAALLVFGGLAGYAGGASITKGALRVAFWGAFAMGLTAVVGRLFGAAV